MRKALASLFICTGLVSFASEQQPCQPMAPTAKAPFDSCRYLPLANGIHPPKIVRDPDPDLSTVARKANLTNGSVTLALAIDEKGTVVAVKVVRSSDPRFEPTAMDTIKQWVFRPAIKDGKPVGVQLTVTASFESR